MSRTLAPIPLVLMSVLGLPAGASAHNCANDQVARVRVFEQDGVYRACLRGYPSHRLGLVRPDRRRVKGTMFAYTTRVKGDDFIAALDLADGTRWLRGRPAGGVVARLRLRAVGALIWTTDTGGVFVSSATATVYRRPDGTTVRERHGAAKVDQLAAPATGLRITRRHTASDICADQYAFTFHWRAAGLPREVGYTALETYNCG